MRAIRDLLLVLCAAISAASLAYIALRIEGASPVISAQSPEAAILDRLRKPR